MGMSDGTPPPPPEAEFIRLARLARGLSPEQAAPRTGIKLSGSRWRHIEQGYSTKDKPVRAPAKTLAHMARTVGVTPERLVEAGREDAAEILWEIQRQESEHSKPFADLSDPDERTIWGMNVPEETRRTLIELLRRDMKRQRRAG